MKAITAADVDILRQLAEQGGSLRLDEKQVSSLTLGAKLELASAVYNWRSRGCSMLASYGLKLTAADPQLAAIMESLLTGAAQPVEPYTAPTFEVQPTPMAPSDRCHDFFCNRFRKSLVDNGKFAKNTANKLVGALGEMIDNVIQHSGSTKEQPARGIMAYSVQGERMVYAVADVGRGVLASLQTNATWAGLRTASDALKEAVLNSASSRIGFLGTGFKTAIRALADLTGSLRFRTGDAALEIDGQRALHREGSSSASPSLPGLQLSVTCARTGKF